MSGVRQSQLNALRPYLLGEQPLRKNVHGEREWDCVCPLHEDAKRSASLNLDTGEFWCFAHCGATSVREVIRRKSEWVPLSVSAANGGTHRHVEQREQVSEARIQGWQAALESNRLALDYLQEHRGLNQRTIERFELGWHPDKKTFTIPVRSPEGDIWNIRFYKPSAGTSSTKIWNNPGMVATALYPIQVLTDDRPERIIVCEGEWDALLTIQNGFPAVTRTASADTWWAEWNEHFKDLVCYVGHDADLKGQVANRKVARALLPFAKEVRLLELPYPIVEKHGKDLSDFWQEYDASHFEQILARSRSARSRPRSDEPELVSVLESFDAKRVGLPTQLLVTIKGKREPGYTIPKQARLACSQDAGNKCNYCSMKAATGGEAIFEVMPTAPLVLELMDATRKQVTDAIRSAYGAQVCNRLVIEPEGHQAVEVLYARPSIDHGGGTHASNYKTIKLTSVGRHDTLPNNTVRVSGALQPHPRSQLNEFLSWAVERVETSVDRFEPDERLIALMRRFQAKPNQRPLSKLAEISKELSTNVTKIYGRSEMHALIDLVFHSARAFKFSGELIARGWLDALVLGDTRTGKSIAAERISRHYAAGEIVGGESASFAGIVGGLQQFGSGREWSVTWGVLPINDLRLVVIDELSGLSREDIAKLSDIRASGEAKLTKIQQEVTLARTRFLALSNPREARMSDYTYGVQALPDLIGNAEDIARFDLAMAVAIGDVSPELMNRPYEVGEPRYTSEACAALVRWVWTRTAEQVSWAAEAEALVYKLALEMGGRYVEDPPLVQVANIRIKIARVAVALAARLFSTDDSCERIVVKAEHVRDAVAFMDKLYSMPSMGYAERSAELIADSKVAESKREETKRYLASRPYLAKFLRGQGHFRRQDLEEILNMGRDDANSIINTLYESRMVRKDRANVKVEPTLHKLLREVRL